MPRIQLALLSYHLSFHNSVLISFHTTSLQFFIVHTFYSCFIRICFHLFFIMNAFYIFYYVHKWSFNCVHYEFDFQYYSVSQECFIFHCSCSSMYVINVVLLSVIVLIGWFWTKKQSVSQKGKLALFSLANSWTVPVNEKIFFNISLNINISLS